LYLFHFEQYAAHTVSDTSRGSEVLISVDAPDKAYVDTMAEKIQKAGGNLYSQPAEIQGWMYGLAMKDLDGHCWNILYMDEQKMPAGS